MSPLAKFSELHVLVCDTLDPNLKCAKFELEVISTNGDSHSAILEEAIKIKIQNASENLFPISSNLKCSLHIYSSTVPDNSSMP